MGQTPEAKVKNMVRKLIGEFTFDRSVVHYGVPNPHCVLYSFWPVQNGMGSPSLDCLLCYYGHWIAIETKAPGKRPTPRQELTIEQMKAAGGLVFVVDNEASLDAVRQALIMLRLLHANDSKSEA